MRPVRHIFIAPLCEPMVLWIDGDDYRATQALVGGTMDSRGIAENLAMVCNDDGISLGLPPNMRTGNELIVGNIVITRYDAHGDTVDVTDADVQVVAKWVASCARPAKFEYTTPVHIVVSGDDLQNVRAEVAAKVAVRPPILIKGVAIYDPADSRPPNDGPERNGGRAPR